MKKKPIIVANWKMYRTYRESVAWFEEHRSGVIQLAEKCQLILCPSFVALANARTHFIDTAVMLGAQNCSAHEKGAYTGQVPARSLAEVGCRYVIIGHSERRLYDQKTDEIVAQKMIRIFESGMVPIICVGESLEERTNGWTKKIIDQQLAPVISALQLSGYSSSEKIIAYEPRWAIGSGEVAFVQDVNEMHEYILSLFGSMPFTFLYGGSVNSNVVTEFRKQTACQGFLIGGASLDFQELKKIVDLL